MGRVGDDHLVPLDSQGVEPGPHEQESGELARRPGRGLQGGGGHAGDLAQRLFELDQELEPPLGAVGGRGGMDVGQAGQAGHGVADLGVVLHGARAQRVGAEIDGELAVAETGEVADEVALRHLGQCHRGGPPMVLGHELLERPTSGTSGRPELPGRVAPAGRARRAWARCRGRAGAHSAAPTTRSGSRISEVVHHHRTAFSKADDEGVDLGPGATFGHGHEEPVARRRRCSLGSRATPARNPSSAIRSMTISASTGRRTANSRSTGRPPAASTPGTSRGRRGSSAPPGPSAAPPRPGPTSPASQLDGGRHRHQGLVGADVGGRLLPADVLLAGPQGRHVGPPALGVDGLAHQAPGQPPDLVQARRRTGPGRGRRSPGACRRPGPPPPPRRRPARRASAGRRRPPGRRPPPAAAPVRSHSARASARSSRQPEIVGVGDHDDAGRIVAGDAADAQSVVPVPRAGRRPDRWPVPAAKVAEHRPPVGWTPCGHPDAWRPVAADGQVDRLDERRRPVVERGVGHRQAGQPGHHGLVLEDGLQHALGHLGLVGGVGGHELRARRQGPGDRRDLVVVGAGAGEAHQVAPDGPVGRGQVVHVGEDVGLGHARGRGRARRPGAGPRAPRRRARRATRARGTRAWPPPRRRCGGGTRHRRPPRDVGPAVAHEGQGATTVAALGAGPGTSTLDRVADPTSARPCR